MEAFWPFRAACGVRTPRHHGAASSCARTGMKLLGSMGDAFTRGKANSYGQVTLLPEEIEESRRRHMVMVRAARCSVPSQAIECAPLVLDCRARPVGTSAVIGTTVTGVDGNSIVGPTSGRGRGDE